MEIMQDLSKILLFDGLTSAQVDEFLSCIKAKTVKIKKGEEVFASGQKITKVALVIKGVLAISRIDFWGRRDILSSVTENNLFGGGYAYSDIEENSLSVTATCDSEIILIDALSLITPCQKSCFCHSKVMVNLIKILAKRNVKQIEKIKNLSARTTREKILSLLSSYKSVGKTITLPYNRQEMADYLCVDRASLSRELSILQKEGIIKYNKNKFIINNEK